MKMKPAFKFFLAALVVGILFGLYYAFGPKKIETETVKNELTDSTKAVNTITETTPSVIETIVSQTEISPVVTKTISTNTNKARETSTNSRPTKVKDVKSKKQKEDRENLNVNFN